MTCFYYILYLYIGVIYLKMTVKMIADTQKYYDDMILNISSAGQIQWEQAITAAEAKRLREPAVMDSEWHG